MVSYSHEELYSTLNTILSGTNRIIDFLHRIEILLSRGVDVTVADGNYSFSPLDLTIKIYNRRLYGHILLLDLMLRKRSSRQTLMNKLWSATIRPIFDNLSDDKLFEDRYFNLCDTKVRLNRNISDGLYSLVCQNNIITRNDKSLMNLLSICEIKYKKRCHILATLYIQFMLVNYNKDVLAHIIKMLIRKMFHIYMYNL